MKEIDNAINEVKNLKNKFAKTIKANDDAKKTYEAESDEGKKEAARKVWVDLVEKSKETLKPLTDK